MMIRTKGMNDRNEGRISLSSHQIVGEQPFTITAYAAEHSAAKGRWSKQKTRK